ncbi:DUF1697 domain-containing protein [soil metagenome]
MSRNPARHDCSQLVALLRGINVGGNNRVPMADLRECMTEIGAADVATYIQSGNVLFDGGRRSAAAWATRIEAALSKRFDYVASVVMRDHAELRAVVKDAPSAFGAEPDRYREDVVFLKAPMTAATALEQMRARDGVDVAVAGDGVVYVSRLAERASQSYFSTFVGTPAYKQSTIRNWRTTTTLLAMLDQREVDAS